MFFTLEYERSRKKLKTEKKMECFRLSWEKADKILYGESLLCNEEDEVLKKNIWEFLFQEFLFTNRLNIQRLTFFRLNCN